MVALPQRRRSHTRSILLALLVAAAMAVPAGALLAPHAAVANATGVSGSAPPLYSAAAAAFEGRIAGASHLGHPTVASPSGPLALRAPVRPAEGATPTLPPTTSPLAPTGAAASVLASTTGLASSGSVPAHAIYPPSLHLLRSPPKSPAQAVSPTYSVGPAPMGLADFGLGPLGTNYSVYTPDVLGTLTLNGYNATAGPMYEDTGAYFWNGLDPNSTISPWQSGVQLNTVVANVSYPGANNGSFWTQNVVDFSGNSIQLIDNIWNFSNPTAYLAPGTFYSYSGFPVYPQFYYAIGPTLPIAYPMSIQLYNNASVVAGRTTVTFGYRISEPTQNFSGIYDQVEFNSEPTNATPLLTPDYLVSGANTTPLGLLYDAELVFGGPGGGSNSVINAINGSMAIDYRLGSAWSPASSAYSYGADTGETAIGVVGWYNNSTEFLNQGPALMDGLWNTTGGVPSGAQELNASFYPDYAFVFVGNDTTPWWNLSYVPLAANGSITTWLPPGSYIITVWADGFDPSLFGFSGPVVGGFANLHPDPFSWYAPLYMNGLAQAESLAANTTGWTSGPLIFADLSVDVSQVFNHVNDFGFPEFSLLWAYNVSALPLWVFNVSQGPDNGSSTIYYGDAPNQSLNAPGLGGEFAVWNGANDVFANLNLTGYLYPGFAVGGAISLWNSTNVSVEEVSSLNGSYGVWAASSPGTEVANSNATNNSVVFSLLATSLSGGVNLTATDGSAAVLAEGGYGDAFQYLNASGFSDGLYALCLNSSTVNDVLASFESIGVDLLNATNDYFSNLGVNTSSLGVQLEYTNLIGISTVNVSSTIFDTFASAGVASFETNWTTITGLNVNDSLGAQLELASNVTISDVVALNDSAGVSLFADGYVVASGIVANNSLGIYVQDNWASVSISGVTASSGGLGAQAEFASSVTITDVAAWGSGYPPTLGAQFYASENVSASALFASGDASALNVTYGNNTTVSAVTATDNAVGVQAAATHNLSVSGVVSTYYATGVVAFATWDLSLSGFWANDSSTGAVLFGTNWTWASGFAMDTDGVGVLSFGTNYTFVAHTTATNGSVGAVLIVSEFGWVNDTTVSNWSIAAALLGSAQVHVAGVVASDPYLTSPWVTPYFYFPVAIGAVVAEQSYQATVSDVRATSYGAALIDNGSFDLSVNALNASFGDFAVLLNGTYGSLLVGVQAYADALGVQMNDGAEQNVVTQSQFVDNAGYGVDIENGDGNTVYDNTFVGNNGATSAYNATHLQAFSSNPSNAFNNSAAIGNYWADWHTYVGGVLAPYYVGAASWDYHPLGAPEGMYLVTFEAAGLDPGTSWSVTLGASTLSTTGAALTFTVAPGSYAFTVSPASNWQVNVSAGSVLVTSGPVDVALGFAQLFPVVFVESGLPAATAWSVWLNGVPMSSTGTSLTFEEPAGSYGYTVSDPTGWSASPSTGSITVGAAYTVPVTYTSTAPPMTTVTVTASGLASGSFTVVFGGVPYTSSGASATFSVPSGSYAYQLAPLAGYTASPASGTVTVSGASYELLVAFTQVDYAVTFAETGLASGTVWSVTVGSQTYTTSLGSVTVQLPNGSVSYRYGNVSGYAIAAPDGSVTVAGGPASVAGPYTPNSTPSYVPSSTFNQDWAIALGIGLLALLVGIVAVLRRPRAPRPPPQPADVPAPKSGTTTTGSSGPQPWSESETGSKP